MSDMATTRQHGLLLLRGGQFQGLHHLVMSEHRMSERSPLRTGGRSLCYGNPCGKSCSRC